MGHAESISRAAFPKFDAGVLEENSFKYPVSINGKTRTFLEFPLDIDRNALEEAVKANADVQKFLDGKEVKKIIYVPKKIINIVA